MAKRRVGTSAVRQLEPLARSASFRPETVNQDDRTVELVWSDGGPPVLRGFWDQFYEKLSMDPKHVRMGRLQSGNASLLNSHDSFSLDSVLGVVESARIDKGGKGIATVRFAKAEDDPEADKIFRKVADGIIKNVSVGYRVHKFEKQKRSADDESSDEDIPTLLATDWEPLEISLVPVPADAGAHVRSSAGRLPDSLRGANPCTVVTREEPKTMAARKTKPGKRSPEETEQNGTDETTEEIEVEDEGSDESNDADETSDEEASKPAEPARAARAALPVKRPVLTEAQTRKNERERIARIQDLGRRSGAPAEVIKELIDGSVSIEKACVRLLEVMERADKENASTSGHSGIQVGMTDKEKFARGVTAWLITRGGAADTVRKAIDQKKIAAQDVDLDPGEFRGLTLLELARMCLERSGVKTRSLGKMELVSKAFTTRGGEQSTSDFPVLLETAMYKSLQAAYKIVSDTWRRFCAVGQVGDFRPHNRYRQGAMGVLPTVPEADEYENMTVPDGERVYVSIGTKGGIVQLTRQTIINDDLGALINQSMKMARQAALTIETTVYAQLALNSGAGPVMPDGYNFFSTQHGNIGSGGPLGGTTGVSALDANRVQFKTQMDPNKNELLDIAPKILLVPAGLGATARVLNTATFDPSQLNKFQVPNAVAGMFTDIIDTARIAQTRRYLFADPAEIPAIEVDFLDGIQDPFLETREGWRVDGVEYKVRLDFGVNFIDWRGALTDPGT
jgi:HK97 family phage prohead protease